MYHDKCSDVVGVVPVRFQVPSLHEGHRFVLDYVLERHAIVLIIIGASYTMTDRNPLSFEMRKMMVEQSYPRKFVIVSSDYSPSSYLKRSEGIDQSITRRFPNHRAIIYGSRDSFIHTYKGKFETHEVPTVFSGSATQVRERVGVINSPDFRSGIIYANLHRRFTVHPAVDVAILNRNSTKVLLVGKADEEGRLRFPGVFFNGDTDQTYEGAAIRCLMKELPDLKTTKPQLVGSMKIEDWRFRKTQDTVISLLMRARWVKGTPQIGSGVDSVEWVSRTQLEEKLIEAHRPLSKLLLK